MKEKPLKFNKDSKLTIIEDNGMTIVRDIFGNEHERKRVRRYIAETETDLGSIVKPNKKIIGWEWNIPNKKGISGRI